MKLDFCAACGAKKNLHHHHLVPRSKGGSDDEKNLVTLCSTRKGGCHAKAHSVSNLGGISSNHSELIKAGLERARKAGDGLSFTPYGFDRVSGQLVQNGMEQKVLAMIRERLNDGHSLNGVARWLNTRGVKAKNGGRWYHGTIQGALAIASRYPVE